MADGEKKPANGVEDGIRRPTDAVLNVATQLELTASATDTDDQRSLQPLKSRTKPVIQLEVMTKCEMITVLVILVFAAGLSFGLNFLAVDFGRTTTWGASNTTACLQQENSSIPPDLDFEFLSTLTAPCFPSSSIFMATYNLSWTDANGMISRVGFDVNSTTLTEPIPMMCNFSQVCINPKTGAVAGGAIVDHNFTLQCSTKGCTQKVVDISDGETDYWGNGGDFDCTGANHGPNNPWYLSVSCNMSFRDWGTIVMTVVDSDPFEYTVIAWVRAVLMAWSILVLCIWLAIFYKKGLLNTRSMVSEQKWVTLMLCVCILTNDVIPSLIVVAYIRTNPGIADVAHVSSVIELVIGEGALLMLQLLLAKGGRQQKLRNYGFRFYLVPAIIMILFLGFGFAFTGLFVKDVNGIILVFVLLVALIAITIIAIIILIVELFRTIRTLSKLPYLPTRYRQLSLRFFILQATVMIMVMVGNIIVTFFKVDNPNTNYFMQDYTWPLLLCIYSTLLAVVYLPPLRRAKPNNLDKHIDLDLAGWLLTFTRATYKSPPPSFPVTMVTRHFKAKGKKVEAKAPGPEYRIKGTELDISGLRFELLHVIHNSVTDTTAFVCRQGSKLVLAFRGTKGMTNIKTDLAAFPHTIDSHIFNQPAEWEPFESEGGMASVQHPEGTHSTSFMHLPLKVHQGFWRAYLSVRPELLRTILSYSDTKHIYVTGHSLGGALAKLASLDLTHHDRIVTMVSYGSPRVGNHEFHRYFTEHVPHALRVVVDGDPVPTIPEFKFLWYQVYKHVGAVVVVDTHGNSIGNPLFVEHLLKTSSTTFSSHKTENYEKALDACLKFQNTTAMSETVKSEAWDEADVAPAEADSNSGRQKEEGVEEDGAVEMWLEMEESSSARAHPVLS